MVLATECTLAVEPLFGTAKGVRGNLLPPGRARPFAAQLVGARVGRISTCATCGETRPTLRTGRALAHLCSCVCGCSSRAVCVGLAPLRGFQCKKWP